MNSSDASDALCSTRATTTHTTRESDDDQRVQHDERAARRGDALAALAVERERVADDRGDAEHARAGPAADGHPAAGRDRALGEVEEQHERPGPPAEQPVRRSTRPGCPNPP